jgi:hypothetical protein
MVSDPIDAGHRSIEFAPMGNVLLCLSHVIVMVLVKVLTTFFDSPHSVFHSLQVDVMTIDMEKIDVEMETLKTQGS